MNARFREVKIRQPFGLTAEQQLRVLVDRRIGRGRVEVKVQLVVDGSDPGAAGSGALATLGVDAARLATVLAGLTEIERAASENHVELSPINSLELLKFLASLRTGSGDAVTTHPSFLPELVDEALAELSRFREREGEALELVLRKLVAELGAKVVRLRRTLVGESEGTNERLAGRLAALCERAGVRAPDPDRVAVEVALLVAKADVDEELARIDSHMGQLIGVLDAEPRAGQGKTLDFLCQELLREVSTIGGKITSHVGSAIVIEAKGTVERIREQVQNVE